MLTKNTQDLPQAQDQSHSPPHLHLQLITWLWPVAEVVELDLMLEIVKEAAEVAQGDFWQEPPRM
jgi:hypothetical protein